MSSSRPATVGVGQSDVRSSETRGLTDGGKSQDPHWDSAVSRLGLAPPQGSWRVVPATAGDQPAILQLLFHVFHRQSAADFQAQLEEPCYEPSDRLLIKSGRTIVAHLRLIHREMRFGALVLPVGLVADVATLPEFRRQGCATALLAAAQRPSCVKVPCWACSARKSPASMRGAAGSSAGGTAMPAGPARSCRVCTSAKPNRRATPSSCLDRPPKTGPTTFVCGGTSNKAALRRLYKENTQHVVRSPGADRSLLAMAGASRRQRTRSTSPSTDRIGSNWMRRSRRSSRYAATREGRILEMM